MSDPNDKQKCWTCPGCGKSYPSECDWCSNILPKPSCAPRADGSAAEVKRYDIYMHSDDVQFLRECADGDYVRFSAYDSLLAQLPEGMKHCTIKLAECAKCERHWLQPTNWVDHGCPHCERDALASRVAELERDAARYQALRSGKLHRDGGLYVADARLVGRSVEERELDQRIDAALSKGAQT